MLAADGADEPVMKRIKSLLAHAGTWLDDLLFPEDVLCLCCDRALGAGEEDGVCKSCRRALNAAISKFQSDIAG